MDYISEVLRRQEGLWRGLFLPWEETEREERQAEGFPLAGGVVGRRWQEAERAAVSGTGAGGAAPLGKGAAVRETLETGGGALESWEEAETLWQALGRGGSTAEAGQQVRYAPDLTAEAGRLAVRGLTGREEAALRLADGPEAGDRLFAGTGWSAERRAEKGPGVVFRERGGQRPPVASGAAAEDGAVDSGWDWAERAGSAARLSRALEEDARRYDGGFPLY